MSAISGLFRQREGIRRFRGGEKEETRRSVKSDKIIHA